jgi:hypothetical protein
LIGHPFELNYEATVTLDGIRRLGMDVTVHSGTWYKNPYTMQVVVCHPPTVRDTGKTDVALGGV